MTVYIFVGPTLAVIEAAHILDAVYLPPAAQGDVYRVAERRPVAIGIIDGYFQKVPSVWHKEVLWSMDAGIYVFGSASMGALRAAELKSFGMIGVGKIFEGYSSGEFTDDDEVAVIHGPPEVGYVPLSDAMVNIRATLSAAENAAVIASTTRRELTNIAKQMFFPERTYDTILDLGAKRGLSRKELRGLRAWLPGGKVDQKKNDALDMLRAMKEFLDVQPERQKVKYFIEDRHVLG